MLPSDGRFPSGFFTRGALAIAPDLLGCTLVRRLGDGAVLFGTITETEAYLPDDPACHACRGPTARNASMFLTGGHAYVYFIYGMHFCVNVVTGPAGQGEAVLLRALRGAVCRRPELQPAASPPIIPDARTTGPGRLCRAFEIDRALDGADLTDVAGPLCLLPRTGPAPTFVTTPRVGIRHNAEVPWRFVVLSSPPPR